MMESEESEDMGVREMATFASRLVRLSKILTLLGSVKE